MPDGDVRTMRSGHGGQRQDPRRDDQATAAAPPGRPGGREPARNAIAAAVAEAHRREWAFVLAATARVTRDLDAAEECVQDAYVAALDAWARQGVPRNPGAWLTTAARHRALDTLRRDRALRTKLPLLIVPEPASGQEGGVDGADVIADDRLRL